MSEGIFTHRIDLIVILRDAVTGTLITDTGTEFFRNGQSFKLLPARDLGWIGVNTGREGFRLGVKVRGFEENGVSVRYEILDVRQPTVELHLIPVRNVWRMPPLLTLKGRLEGLEKLWAVSFEETDLYFVSCEEDGRKLSLYNPHRRRLGYSVYAVVDRERQEFETVTVLKALSDSMVLLDHEMKKKWKGNHPFVRPICGMVSETGEYLLRVPESKEPLWLVGYEADQKEYFRTVDFRNPVLLEEGKQKKTRKRG